MPGNRVATDVCKFVMRILMVVHSARRPHPLLHISGRAYTSCTVSQEYMEPGIVEGWAGSRLLGMDLLQTNF